MADPLHLTLARKDVWDQWVGHIDTQVCVELDSS